MKLSVEIDATELKKIVFAHIAAQLGDVTLKPEDIRIEVKSRQNYRSEWEDADFRARVEKHDA